MTTNHCYQINGESMSGIIYSICIIPNMMQLHCNGIFNNLVDFHDSVMFDRGEFCGNFTHCKSFSSKGFVRFLMDFLKSKEVFFCLRCTRFSGN